MRLGKTRKAYFAAARAMAQLSDFPRIKIGSVAVFKHHIISSGCNTQRTEPIQKKLNIYRFPEDTNHCTHAEVACLKPLLNRNDIDFKHVDLYVYREYKNGELACARPCPSCMALIRELGIKSIYFTDFAGYSHEEILD